MIPNLYTQYATKLLELRSTEPRGPIARVLSRVTFGDKPLENRDVDQIWNTPEIRTIIRAEAGLPTEELAYRAFIQHFPYHTMLLNEHNTALLERTMLDRGFQFQRDFIDNERYKNLNEELEEYVMPSIEQGLESNPIAVGATDDLTATEPPSHQATQPQSYQATEPQSDPATELPIHSATQPQSDPATELPIHQATQPQSDPATGLPSYSAAQLQSQSTTSTELDVETQNALTNATITTGDQLVAANVIEAKRREQREASAEVNINGQSEPESIRANMLQLQKQQLAQQEEFRRRQILSKRQQEEEQKQAAMNQQQSKKKQSNLVKTAIALTTGGTIAAVGLPASFSIFFS